ncbi:UNVERIFIED_CONTAM: hypothetical protein GTU68_064044 [Idotea baltica]|nr:hypothetical protein [Idotea baltica]
MGTRFIPATKSIPKEILTLVDRPLIQYAIDEARDAGIEDFIFVTARGKASLEDYFDHAPELEARLKAGNKIDLLQKLRATDMLSGAISYVRQREALGLGHAVNCARRLIGNEPFAVILTDDIIQTEGRSVLRQMVEEYSQLEKGHMVATMEVSDEEISSYGVINPADPETKSACVRAKGLVEKPALKDAPSNLAVIGRYILDPEIFNYLNRGQVGAGGEIQLTDAIDYSANHNGNVYGFNFEGQRYDCGNKLGYLKATIAFGLENIELSAGFREHILEIAKEL